MTTYTQKITFGENARLLDTQIPLEIRIAARMIHRATSRWLPARAKPHRFHPGKRRPARVN